jgi:hypothetical protein
MFQFLVGRLLETADRVPMLLTRKGLFDWDRPKAESTFAAMHVTYIVIMFLCLVSATQNRDVVAIIVASVGCCSAFLISTFIQI